MFLWAAFHLLYTVSDPEERQKAKEKSSIPVKHLRQIDVIRWRDFSSPGWLVYFLWAFGFLIQHHLSLAANRDGAGLG